MTATVAKTPLPARSLELLLVDDHRIFADVLAARLLAEPAIRRVDRASTLAAARSLLATWRPDVLLLDLHLDSESGLDLLEDLRPDGPAVIMVSGSGDVGGVIDAISAGALGWVPKDSPVEVLLDAASIVAHGNMFLPPALLGAVVQTLLRDHLGATVPGLLDEVTPRELEVLRCLVAGMSRSDIAGRLFLSTNTVRTHVQNLLRRADVHSTLALVATARELGVRGIDEPESALARRSDRHRWSH
jgi:DNA-binding NarL/FixJ family response regulator